MNEPTIVVVVGNPSPGGRTSRAAKAVAEKIAESAHGAEISFIELAHVAPLLFDPDATEVNEHLVALASSDLAVIASPTYKALHRAPQSLPRPIRLRWPSRSGRRPLDAGRVAHPPPDARDTTTTGAHRTRRHHSDQVILPRRQGDRSPRRTDRIVVGADRETTPTLAGLNEEGTSPIKKQRWLRAKTVESLVESPNRPLLALSPRSSHGSHSLCANRGSSQCFSGGSLTTDLSLSMGGLRQMAPSGRRKSRERSTRLRRNSEV